MTFRDLLIDQHAEQYEGLDDDMGEDFAEWLQELDIEDVIDLADTYGQQRFDRAREIALDTLTK